MADRKRKLIEVALPLEAINRESAREKSIRHGHPSTLHLWWARRPLAAARAVLFAQLVDDPSARPEEFPTEELQRKERERLHRLIERLVVWENVRDEKLFAEAHAEILKSTDGSPPLILDPFAGGGTIPLEAQRLGLEAHASDLNPVAVLINKALIEIPPRFRDQPPVFPGLADTEIRTWKGAEGLAADVRAYGQWMRDEAQRRIGHLYPKAMLSDGSEATVIAWIWARTVTCPNPACGIEMPLVRSWWLGKKKGKEAYVVPRVVADSTHPSGQRVRFDIGHDPAGAPTKESDGTVGRTGATCLACQTAVDLKYVRAEGRAGRIGSQLMAVVAEGERRRVYLQPTTPQIEAAAVERPGDAPEARIPPQAPSFRVQAYGMTTWADLFTNRQLVALTTFSDLVMEARERVLADGGTPEYGDAVATYLGLGVSRMTDIANALCRWENTKEQVRNLFGRQAIPMLWDFAETRPFGKAAGAFEVSLGNLVKALRDTGGPPAVVQQADASSRSYDGLVVSTDPPYYDNIGYSDLSDFFYVWLRRSLRAVRPDLLSTMLVPKAEELVANPYRHDGRVGAREFFEDGFREVFARARESAREDVPITVWYAFKQSESDASGEASTGWETLLEGMIHSGWEITSTWPNRSELGNRMIASGTNALASSIVLSLRPRDEAAPSIDRRGFIAALEAELPDALRKLQQGQIAPVDLPQAAIGPGMAVFSRYSGVIENDGTTMTVRSALARINEILDAVLSEQESDLDPVSRFALAWYRQHGYGQGLFGAADSLARARNTSVTTLEREEILTSRAGVVKLIGPAELPADYDPVADLHISNWEVLHHLVKTLERDGIGPAGDLLRLALSREDRVIEADLVKELAHLLFRIAEGNGWTKDALAFNALVTSWPEITEAAQRAPAAAPVQGAFDFDEED
ncbi:MAG: DUF1156 domain-containing protein [Nocardioides sp.]|uniref:DUF1156 domain-containing protein n=1 Tax=Nocardioides sp. TaxID=35761 RepID=UPI0039E28891